MNVKGQPAHHRLAKMLTIFRMKLPPLPIRKSALSLVGKLAVMCMLIGAIGTLAMPHGRLFAIDGDADSERAPALAATAERHR